MEIRGLSIYCSVRLCHFFLAEDVPDNKEAVEVEHELLMLSECSPLHDGATSCRNDSGAGGSGDWVAKKTAQHATVAALFPCNFSIFSVPW
jgi:hypothetical protein